MADRFHAIRLVLHHLLKLARQLCPELAWNRSWLHLLRQRHDRLDPAQRLRLLALFARQPALQGLDELKERLCALLSLKAQTKRECRQHIPRLLELIQTLQASGLAAAVTLGPTLHDWREEIVRLWRCTRNNGIT